MLPERSKCSQYLPSVWLPLSHSVGYSNFRRTWNRFHPCPFGVCGWFIPFQFPSALWATSESKFASMAPSAPFAMFAATPFSSSSNQPCFSHQEEQIALSCRSHVFIRKVFYALRSR